MKEILKSLLISVVGALLVEMILKQKRTKKTL
jgi:hypothetical protein